MTRHVIPASEAGEHQTTTDCSCGPVVKHGVRGDGTYGEMVLHGANAPRADAPRALANRDPVRALIAAERDGLLTYLGYSGDSRYEVVLAGEERELPREQVAPTVERLRAVKQLASVNAEAQLVAVTDETYVLDLAGRRWAMPAAEVANWCGGYVAAARGQGEEHAGDDQLVEIRPLLRTPSIPDQCRLVLIGLMEGGNTRITRKEMAAKIGTTRKTVIEALSFGNSLDPDLADRMIAVFGLRWLVSAVGPEVADTPEGTALAALPQMPGIKRLERIMAAVDLGWVRYVDEPSLNKARWSQWYELAVGQRSYVVDAGGLDAWLDGVAAFHGQDVERKDQG